MKRWTPWAVLCLTIGSLVVAGCETRNDQNAPKTEIRVKTAETEEDRARQAQLQQAMTAAVRRSTDGKWDSASAEDRQPFLDFHQADEAAAKKHYETLVENQREIDANLAGQ